MTTLSLKVTTLSLKVKAIAVDSALQRDRLRSRCYLHKIQVFGANFFDIAVTRYDLEIPRLRNQVQNLQKENLELKERSAINFVHDVVDFEAIRDGYAKHQQFSGASRESRVSYRPVISTIALS